VLGRPLVVECGRGEDCGGWQGARPGNVGILSTTVAQICSFPDPAHTCHGPSRTGVAEGRPLSRMKPEKILTYAPRFNASLVSMRQKCEAPDLQGSLSCRVAAPVREKRSSGRRPPLDRPCAFLQVGERFCPWQWGPRTFCGRGLGRRRVWFSHGRSSEMPPIFIIIFNGAIQAALTPPPRIGMSLFPQVGLPESRNWPVTFP
jgi:hypothetical protein